MAARQSFTNSVSRWSPAAGVVLIVHGLAHALAGMRATAEFQWLPTIAWAAALAGFLAAGFGLLGLGAFQRRWRIFAAVGVAGSAALLSAGWLTALAIPGFAIDAAVLSVLLDRQGQEAERPRHPLHMVDIAAFFLIASLTTLVLARPWHMRWGSSDAELRAALPGDELQPVSRYVIQHAVTIDAPPEAVWPWLAQLGEDHGGFYSYAWLENLFGLHIRNADRVHSEWQQVEAGDSIFGTHAGWLGFDRRFGWRVARVDQGRVLFLERWGAFVLVPDGEGRTRLIVRTRGGGTDRMQDVLLAPLGFMLGEPAHFIMERRMLLTLKRLAASRDVPSRGRDSLYLANPLGTRH